MSPAGLHFTDLAPHLRGEERAAMLAAVRDNWNARRDPNATGKQRTVELVSLLAELFTPPVGVGNARQGLQK